MLELVHSSQETIRFGILRIIEGDDFPIVVNVVDQVSPPFVLTWVIKSSIVASSSLNFFEEVLVQGLEYGGP